MVLKDNLPDQRNEFKFVILIKQILYCAKKGWEKGRKGGDIHRNFNSADFETIAVSRGTNMLIYC